MHRDNVSIDYKMRQQMKGKMWRNWEVKLSASSNQVKDKLLKISIKQKLAYIREQKNKWFIYLSKDITTNWHKRNRKDDQKIQRPERMLLVFGYLKLASSIVMS